MELRGWSFMTCEGGWGGGHFAFCWGVISKILIVVGGHFQKRKRYLGGSFYEKWYKEIFSCYVSEEIDVRSYKH